MQADRQTRVLEETFCGFFSTVHDRRIIYRELLFSPLKHTSRGNDTANGSERKGTVKLVRQFINLHTCNNSQR